MGINHVVFNADYREFFEINDPQRMKFDEIQDVAALCFAFGEKVAKKSGNSDFLIFYCAQK